MTCIVKCHIEAGIDIADLDLGEDAEDIDLFELINETEVLSLVKKINKSSGLDGINSKFLIDALLHVSLKAADAHLSKFHQRRYFPGIMCREGLKSLFQRRAI